MKRFLRRICCALFLFVICIAAVQFAKHNPSWITQSYKPFSRQFCALLGRMTSFTRYSVMEIALYILIVCFVFGLLTAVFFLFFGKKARKRALRIIADMVLIAAVLLSVFVGAWGLNYYGEPLAEQMALSQYPISQQALEEAYAACIARANEESDAADRAAYDDFDRMADDVRDTAKTWLYQNINDASWLYVSRVKYILSDKVMSYGGYTGVFCPITGEPNVNPATFPVDLPMTMAHETGHSMASAPEDETNFLAFLICRESTEGYIRYSAYYEAAIHLGNALYKADHAAYRRISETMCDTLREDMRRTNAHYEPYEGKLQDSAQKVNDTYLKTMGQKSGTLSYGEAADLLVQLYLAQGRL